VFNTSAAAKRYICLRFVYRSLVIVSRYRRPVLGPRTFLLGLFPSKHIFVEVIYDTANVLSLASFYRRLELDCCFSFSV